MAYPTVPAQGRGFPKTVCKTLLGRVFSRCSLAQVGEQGREEKIFEMHGHDDRLKVQRRD
jgi:hypothetical protein